MKVSFLVRKQASQMFTFIGKYYSKWYTNPIGFMRRLAQQNPTDYGKLVVFMTIMSWINWYVLTHLEEVVNFMLRPLTGKTETPDLAEQVYPEIHPGDGIIFNSDGYNIEGIVKNLVRGNILVQVAHDDFEDLYEIKPSQVLNVSPQF